MFSFFGESQSTPLSSPFVRRPKWYRPWHNETMSWPILSRLLDYAQVKSGLGHVILCALFSPSYLICVRSCFLRPLKSKSIWSLEDSLVWESGLPGSRGSLAQGVAISRPLRDQHPCGSIAHAKIRGAHQLGSPPSLIFLGFGKNI